MMSITTLIKKKAVAIILAAAIVFLAGYVISRVLTLRDGIYVRAFRVEEGWGYQVEVNEKVYIYQPFIPGRSDKKAFPDRKSALKTGKLVETKLKQGVNPAVSSEEINDIIEK